jgi:hypothetical protein
MDKRRKKRLFGPVSGSSSVGVGVASTSLIGGGVALPEAFVGVFWVVVFGGSVSTAFGFEGALSTSSQNTFSGLGVIKSWSAEAPSVIVDPETPIQAITVSVYELASTKVSSRVISTDCGLSAIAEIASSLMVVLSDCFITLSTTLSESIASEKFIRICLSSVTFTDVTERGAVTAAANTRFHVKHTRRSEKIDLKKLFIPWGFRKNRYTLQSW